MTRSSHTGFLPLLAAALLLGAPWHAAAQGHATAQEESLPPTGNLTADIREGLRQMEKEETFQYPELNKRPRKSVLLAGALSAAIPGAGQVYTEAPLWRTVLYGLMEAAGWTAFGIYTTKGSQATSDFENFADSHWDVTRYVSWIADNYQKWSDLDVNKDAAREALDAIYTSNDPSLRPWERIDFNQLNKLERAVSGGFSHTLPAHGEQQYYEEIGKYIQYRAGWDDHNSAGDTVIFNPARVSARNKNYVEQREDANALLGYATAAIGVVVVNHLVSMVDAGLTARNYNISLDADLHGELMPDGRRTLATGITMRLRF